MEVSLKILTPVHIGSGEVHNRMNYFIMDGYVYFIDFGAIAELISNKEEAFVRWIEDKSRELEELERKKRNPESKVDKDGINRKIKRLKQDFSIEGLCRDLGISVAILRNKSLYRIPLNNNYLRGYPEINAFIKQMNKVYVPGTEIKGAIRTAVIYYLLKSNDKFYNELKQRLKSFREKYQVLINSVKNKKNLRNRLREIIQEEDIPENFKKYSLWRLSNIKNELADRMKKECTDPMIRMILNANARNDGKFDIFKFIQISDTVLEEPGNILSICRLESVNIRRKVLSFNECLKPDVLLSLPDLSLTEGEILSEAIQKTGFNETQSQIVSLDFIKKACYEFANDLLEEEIDFFTNVYRNDDIVNILNELSNLNTIESPLIRIGKDQGYLSITVSLVVKKKDPDIYENVLVHATKNRSYTGKNLLPKNRKIVYFNTRKFPPGWCQLLFEPAKTFASDNNHTRNLDLSPLLKKWGRT